MSIPPLVCSTPPPPDQCEEDKDPDDFGIPYSLSQEDEDDDSFGYGDFSSFNHYQANCITQNKDPVKTVNHISIPNIEQEDTSENNQVIIEKTNLNNGTIIIHETKPKLEDDTNIEDLGLEVNEESISPSDKGSLVDKDEQSETENLKSGTTENVLDVRNDTCDSNESSSNVSNDEILTEDTKNDLDKEAMNDELIDEHPLEFVIQANQSNLTLSEDACKVADNDEETACKYDLTEYNNEIAEKPNIDDDFGDFEDFQFVGTESKVSEIVEHCDNPWETNKADDDDDDFGNFTANFEAVPSQEIVNTTNVNIAVEENDTTIADDDFGDFDNFKSSAVDKGLKELSLESGSDQSLPVIDFQAADSENQVMDSITKVLSTLFEDEVLEPETEFEGRLETMLSETWGHLRETDVRQPYIVSWNNSLGQKTLLKALCIDSRNILFGPKWGYNMPKYAVNLSAAPLQPQKPIVSANCNQSEATSDKHSPKPDQGGWTDPFTADGQESCSTERESTVEVTASDLDMFEATIAAKPDKIYSSTLNVQPLRQISLPDTHIFTPTDSETPTSQTVHYNSGPPILLPQNILESKQTDIENTQHTDGTPKSKDDDDYWDFQDYKSSNEKTTNSDLAQPEPVPEIKPPLDPKVTYQTQVLQPIKMEPIIPTVNWPDPGEIKETFDDFTDFISNSTCDKPQEPSFVPFESKSNMKTDILDKINDKHKNADDFQKTNSNNDNFDDEFDTFQSAPPKPSTSGFNLDGLETFRNIPMQNSVHIADFENAFPKVDNIKSETISVSSMMRPNDTHINQTASTSAPNKYSPLSSKPTVPSLLQPTPASAFTTSQNKQKTAQILQPLSLESYSQINWPNPGIDLQDLSRFNPVETLQSLKSDLSVGGPSKGSSPVHSQKIQASNQVADDDIWGEFVSIKPKQASSVKKPASFPDDDEWSDFVSSPSVKPQNGLNTISLNVHTSSNVQKTSGISKNNQLPLDIPTLNYVTPKANHTAYNDRHFQNL